LKEQFQKCCFFHRGGGQPTEPCQPSESEREGAQPLYGVYPDGSCRACGEKDCFHIYPAAPPSPPSTGQSREQRREEALRAADLMLSLLPVRDESEDAARRGVKEQIRRALESKP
jgi:alkanesulfonate monooxygenase SsuD/methylene tetrahydromethanopterin reductase-like flavin-dependent oxidoreductase (luciferase family)